MIPDIIIQMVDPVDGEVLVEDFGDRFLDANKDDEVVIEAVKALRNGAKSFPVGFYILQIKPGTNAS